MRRKHIGVLQYSYKLVQFTLPPRAIDVHVKPYKLTEITVPKVQWSCKVHSHSRQFLSV